MDVDRATNQRKSPEEGGKVPEVAKVVEGAVVGGVEAEGGDGAEELVDGVAVEGEHFYKYDVYI